jgi:3-deoxy-D-manno-octulosonate 8-phosphate phosphatase (KDO 8-P phosphatase)
MQSSSNPRNQNHSSSTRWAPEILLKAQGAVGEDPFGLRAALFDVDGCLTDGRVYMGEHGEVFKAFNTLDGHGLKCLMQAGMQVLVITGRDSPGLRRRMKDLGIEHALYGIHDKARAAEGLLASLGLCWNQVAVMGDDWPDLPLMAQAAFSCAPANAHEEALALADFVTRREGGYGAARELCDLLLAARGQYDTLLRQTMQTLDASTGPGPIQP